MIKVKNKVVFVRRATGAVDKEYTASSNVQGKLKKQVIKVQKIKTRNDIKVTLTGSYREYKIEIDPADAPEAAKIKAMLKMK